MPMRGLGIVWVVWALGVFAEDSKKTVKRVNPFNLDQLPSFLVDPFPVSSNAPSQSQLASQLSQPVPGNLQVAQSMQTARNSKLSDTELRMRDLSLTSMISPRQALGNRWTQLDNVADFSNSGMELQERNNPPIQALSSLLTGDDTTAATNQAQLVAVHQAKLQSMYDGIGRQEKQIKECTEFIVKLTALNEKNKNIMQSNKDKLKSYSDELVALVGKYTEELAEDKSNAGSGSTSEQGQQGKGKEQQGKGQQEKGADGDQKEQKEQFKQKMIHLKKSVPRKKHSSALF